MSQYRRGGSRLRLRLDRDYTIYQRLSFGDSNGRHLWTKEIEQEMHEAAVEVDKEGRATRVSGLRLLFSPVFVHASEQL